MHKSVFFHNDGSTHRTTLRSGRRASGSFLQTAEPIGYRGASYTLPYTTVYALPPRERKYAKRSTTSGQTLKPSLQHAYRTECVR